MKRYQDVLLYAGSEVNLVFGIYHQMSPGGMLLHIRQVVGYKNEIVIATDDQIIGINNGLLTTPKVTGEICLVKLIAARPSVLITSSLASPVISAKTESRMEADQSVLVVSEVVVSLVALWLLRPRNDYSYSWAVTIRTTKV